MSRPAGSKNAKRKPPRKTIAVRLSEAEQAKLAKVHPSPSRAIHTLIALSAGTNK